MSQKDGSRWELRLGLFQVVVLLGLTMGLLTCTFFLGYFSGRQVGQDAALSASLTNTIKLPINGADQEERIDEGASQRVATEVYAKLNENEGDRSKEKEGQAAIEMPKLGTIDTTEQAPLDTGTQIEEPAAKDASVKEPEKKIEEEAALPEEEQNPSRDQLLKQVIELENNEKKAKEVEKEKTKDGNVKPGKFDEEEKKPVKEAPTLVPTVKPTEAPKKTPTPKPTIAKKVAEQSDGSIPKGWFAQIAAPRKKEDAAELSRQLRKSGFAVIVEVAQVKGEQYYRVLTGPETSREQAEKLVEQLKREPYIPTKPFIRQIK